MRIAIDTETRQTRSLLWDGATAWDSDHLSRVVFTRRDKFPVEIRFVSSAPAGREGAFLSRYGWLAFSDLPAGASGRLYLKSAASYAGAPLAAATFWAKATESGISTYSFYLNLDTVEMAAAFGAEPASLSLVLEIEWTYPIAGIDARQTIIPIPVKVQNDYIRDADGQPVPALDARIKATQAQAEAGTDNEHWMTPLRTAQAIAAQVQSQSGKSTFISPDPPSPVVNGTIWINSATYRAHVLLEGVWAEIATT